MLVPWMDVRCGLMSCFYLGQSLKANASGAVKELKLNSNYITEQGQFVLTEALDLIYELGNGRETTITF